MAYLSATRQTWVHLSVALSVVAIWSGFIVISRIGGRSVLTPYDLAALRFGVSALLLFIPWRLSRQPVRLRDPRIITLALIGGVGYALLVYWGFESAPAVHAAILLPGLLPFEVAFLSWLLLKKSSTGDLHWFALAAISAGIGCVAIDSFNGAATIQTGDWLIFGSSWCWALYTVLVRRWNIPAWEATTGVALLAATFYFPLYLGFLPKQITTAACILIYMQALYQGVLVAVVATALYMKAVCTIGPQRLANWMALVPAISGVVAVPVLNEPLSPWTMGALVMATLGVYLSHHSNRPHQSRSSVN